MAKKFIVIIMLVFLIIPQTVGAMPIFNRRGSVVVLTYHKISENPLEWGDYCIPPDMFESDIEYLKSEGYTFLNAGELAEISADNKGRIAVLTFDDGYESDIKYAVPIIKKCGAKATFFIIGSAVGSDGYLTEQQIFQMSKEQCVEIGSHSDKLHFKSYGELSAMYDDIRCEDEIISDYKNNDNLIYKITGKKPTALSYPNGINSKRIDGKLKEGGKKVTFSTAETTFSGIEKNIPVGRRNRSCQRDIKNILR